MKISTAAKGTSSKTISLVDNKSFGLTRQEWHSFYRTMLLSRRLDDKEIQLKNQSQSYFQISGAGHEAIQIAAGLTLRAGHDWFFPYYRDRALCLTLGVTPYEMLLAAVGSDEDPSSGGRQMPAHWSSPQLHIVSSSSACTTQCLHAIGATEAGQLIQTMPEFSKVADIQTDEISYISLGDGATSGGEFWESLNTACMNKLPVIYLVEDNGYAISVPVETQTPGGDIARLVESFPHLKVIRVDGTDAVASLQAMREAANHARSRLGPTLVKASVTRPYSHSMSDDERTYKSTSERESEASRDPLQLCEKFLKRESLITDQELMKFATDVDQEINAAADRAIAAPKPNPATVDRYIYSPKINPSADYFEVEPNPASKPDTMITAINQTLKDEMARESKIVLFGEVVILH